MIGKTHGDRAHDTALIKVSHHRVRNLKPIHKIWCPLSTTVTGSRSSIHVMSYHVCSSSKELQSVNVNTWHFRFCVREGDMSNLNE